MKKTRAMEMPSQLGKNAFFQIFQSNLTRKKQLQLCRNNESTMHPFRVFGLKY